MHFVLAVAVLLFSAVAAHAQRTVINGQTIQLAFVTTINPDCTSRGAPTIIITQPPRHGRARVVRVSDFPNFRESNVRSVCNRRRVAGTALSYTANRGYSGPDSVGAEVFTSSGVNRRGIFSINVR
jgi:hypothetical protein